MRTATHLALVVCAGVLWAGSALAQTYDVTFQVDMSACIDGGQFDPDTDTVTTPGTMNGWDTTQFPLDDADDDGVYAGTFALEAGDISYKFFASSPLGWEMDPNRTYTVTTDANQVIPVVDFNGVCGGGAPQDYEIRFTVDMNVAVQRGAFDPEEQEIYVAGALNGWDTTGNEVYRLEESSLETNVYSRRIQVDDLPTPSTQPYKFITRATSDGAIGWESGSDRTFEVTGTEPDANGNGYLEVTVARRFFDDVTFDDVLTEAATITFEIDGRPAYYVLEDNGSIPGSPQSETSVDGIWLNGPIMWESDEAGGPGGGIQDWLGWEPGALDSYPEFGATDDDEDSTFTLTLHYSPGALRTLVGKFGVNGRDNEAGFGVDQRFFLDEGSQTIEQVFGAVRQANGGYHDDSGPDADGDGDADPVYDPYCLIDNSVSPPEVEAVRSGGEADGTNTANEPGAELPDGITLGSNYPNPFSRSTAVAFRVERGQEVALRVYDLTGRLVATLAEGFRAAGDHVVAFDARGLAAGAYLYRLEADGRVVSRMMTVLN